MTVGETWMLFCLENLAKKNEINISGKRIDLETHTIVFKVIRNSSSSIQIFSLECEEIFELYKSVRWKQFRSKLSKLFSDLTGC